MNKNLLRSSVGVLVHGRHLQAAGWVDMMWGNPEQHKLGSLPTAVLSILEEGVDHVQVITMGTAASFQHDGTSEAEVTKQFWFKMFDQLENFDEIASHPSWLSSKEKIRSLVERAVTDEQSRKTIEEIANAAQLFQALSVTKVIEVTGASHAPRCQLIQSMAKDSGIIPRSQHWQLVADDMPYTGTRVEDMLIFEEPHRADDPMHNIPSALQPTRVFRRFFTLPIAARVKLLDQVNQLFDATEK